MYTITFTEGFYDDVRGGTPEQVLKAVGRLLTPLAHDPFQKMPRAKRLKNVRDRYRARIGDYRLLYEIQQNIKRVVLLTIKPRQGVYEGVSVGHKPVEPDVEEKIHERLRGKQAQVPGLARTDFESNVLLAINDADHPLSIEQIIEWITLEELWLLGIDPTYHSQILKTHDADELNRESLPESVISRLTDYSTNPKSSQIGKLYSLDRNDPMSISARPLKSFLLALDEEQRRVLARKVDGPLLVKGGPGTGKSLVGLYWMRDILVNRPAESLWSKASRFGVLTYTNTLSDLNELLTAGINPSEGDQELVECSTLDKITTALATKTLNRRPNCKSSDQILRLLEEEVVPRLPASTRELIARLGLPYLLEEIDHVILGYGISDSAEYLAHRRSGRVVPMNSAARTEIWALYQEFLELHKKHKIETWDLMRKYALSALAAWPDYPKFNALFVDEVQDLSRVSRQIILNLVEDRRYLLMSADTGQSIYVHPPTWSETEPGLSLRSRVFVLRRNYRTTREIYRAIEPLRSETADGEGETGRPNPIFTGPPPVWVRADAVSQWRATKEVIKKLEGLHCSGQIAVVVRDHALVNDCVKYLVTNGVAAKPVNKATKIDISGNHVHVITAHSAKGLEFPVVVAPCISDSHYPAARSINASLSEEHLSEALATERRLLYVALSRACHTLVMIENSDNPSRYLSELNPSDWSDAL